VLIPLTITWLRLGVMVNTEHGRDALVLGTPALPGRVDISVALGFSKVFGEMISSLQPRLEGTKGVQVALKLP